MTFHRAIAMLRGWVTRTAGSMRLGRSDFDLEEELRAHLALAADEARRRGPSTRDAARTVRLQGGGVTQALEALRDQRGLPWLRDAGRDLRFACRMLARDRTFAAVAVLSLAMGIGANCAVFSLADTLLLRPLAVPRPGEMLTVGWNDAFSGSLTASYRDYVDIRTHSQSFDGLTAFTGTAVSFASRPGAPARLALGVLVSDNFLQVAGVTPAFGRDFRRDEHDVPGRDAVVILAHDFWVREFAADRAALGRRVRLNGIDLTIIGVVPEGFTGLTQYERFEFFAPLMMWPRLTADADIRPLESRDVRRLTIKGRLKSGTTQARAQLELEGLAANLAVAYPDTHRSLGAAVRTELQNRIATSPPVARLLAMLTGLACGVLLVACANVAGLLTSRAPVRAREMAVRVAIGAGRSRLIRQLLAESALIAGAGGLLGVGVGYAGVLLIRQIQIPTDLPIVATFSVDRRALWFTLVLASVSCLLFGLVPALRSTRRNPAGGMKANDCGPLSRRPGWGQSLLVLAQVAASVVLLVVAMFMYRGFQLQLQSGPGFLTDHLLMMSVAPSPQHYKEAQAQRFFEQLLQNARLVPGVQSASLTRYMPMDGGPPSVTIVPEGFQFPAGQSSAVHPSSMVDEHYFDTIGVPIVKGRAFTVSDSAGAHRVAVVNEVLAQRYWPGQDAVGKRFRLDAANGPWVEVVGVAKTSKYTFIVERPKEFIYFPYRQLMPESMFLLVASNADPARLVGPLRAAIQSLDPELPVMNVRTMAEHYRIKSLAVVDVLVRLVGAMGGMGLLLALAGLYGLVSYGASRRTTEIGIRFALGATRFDVVRLMLQRAMILVTTGLVLGLVASVGANRVLEAVFPGGTAGNGRLDVTAMVVVAAGVTGIAMLAAYLPARKAARLSAVQALRAD